MSAYDETFCRDYIIFVSTIEIRKNHRILIDAYSQMIKEGRSDLPLLIFAGRRGWLVDDLLAEIDAGEGTCRYVQIIEYLSDIQLRKLHKHALFTVYPSSYEGWGIPVAESLTLGKVCICADRSSLPEVAQGLLKLVALDSPSAWAAAIACYLDHPDELAKDEETNKERYEPRSWRDFRDEAKRMLADI